MDEQVSSFAFNFNLRRYNKAEELPVSDSDFQEFAYEWVGPDGYCSPRHPTHFEPLSLELSDTSGPGGYCPPRHPTRFQSLNPCLLSYMTSYDVASCFRAAL
jgi:hypothetical protein